MRISFLIPLMFLGLAGCVTNVREPQPASATVVTPAPTVTYATPSTTTVVRTP